MDFERLQFLIDRHFDELATSEEKSELEQLLLTSDEACERFWNSAELHVQIRLATRLYVQPSESAVPGKVPPRAGQASLESRREPRPLSDQAPDDDKVAPGSPALHRSSASIGTASRWRAIGRLLVRPTPFSMATAGLVLIALVTALAVIPVMTRQFRPPRQTAVDQRPFTAVLTRASQVQWSGDSPSPQQGDVLQRGQRLHLTQGRIEVTYDSGARVLVRGPARFVVTGRQRLDLDQGTAHVHLTTAAARGFTVAAPDGVYVEDLGTEFVVKVDLQQTVETHVLNGSVRLMTATGETHILTAGSAKRVSKRNVTSVAASTAEALEIRGHVVNVDLGKGPVYAGRGAAPDDGMFWNSNGGAARSLAGLKASDGRTDTSIGFTANWKHFGALPDAFVDLFDDYQFSHSNQGRWTLTLTGLDDPKRYDVYVYSSTAWEQGGAFKVGNVTKATRGANLVNFVEGQNYVCFPGVASQSGQLSVEVLAGNKEKRAALVNGFQIVERVAAP